MTRRTVLVTGATGFIGSHVLCRLAADHDVTGVAPGPGTIGKPDIRIHQMSLPHPDMDTLLGAIKPDEIIHCAGNASVGYSMAHPDADFLSGPPVVFQIFNAVRMHGLKSRVTLMSSAAVYGNPACMPVAETTPTQPISPYGWHKLMSEHIAQEHADIFGIPSYSLRIFSCYGPGLQKQLLWDVAQKIHRNALALSGTGNETRDFIHVTDLTRLIALLIDRPALETHTILNVAAGRQTSVGQVADLLREHMGYAPHAHFDGVVRAGDPAHWRADVSRLADIGFTPAISIQKGVADYAQWFQAHAMGENT